MTIKTNSSCVVSTTSVVFVVADIIPSFFSLFYKNSVIALAIVGLLRQSALLLDWPLFPIIIIHTTTVREMCMSLCQKNCCFIFIIILVHTCLKVTRNNIYSRFAQHVLYNMCSKVQFMQTFS